MNMSEAMLAGCKLHPQAFRTLFIRDRDDIVIATCALGALAMGSGFFINGKGVSNVALTKQFPLLTKMVPHPCQPIMLYEVAIIIMSLNDTHRWSREAIAKWLMTVEQNVEKVDTEIWAEKQ